jgi:Ca-activated chloride channel family protein
MKITHSLVLAALLGLSACGGSSGDVSSGGNSSSGGAPIPPVSPPPDDGWPDEPGGGDSYEYVGTNPFVMTVHDPLSTFGVDVDTASYDIFRRDAVVLRLPDPNSVRVEEYINFFRYQYPAPTVGETEHPFHIDLAAAPNVLERDTHILRVGLQAAEVAAEDKKPANLVFLIDRSGSMGGSDRLPLVKLMLIETLELLEPTDMVTIVTYASGAEVTLEPTQVAEKDLIVSTINSLVASGATAGGAGIQLAYGQAEAVYIEGGLNHVILCTDGDFNVGATGDELISLIEEKRETGITFTALGFGSGNLNDAMLEATSNAGNGVYGVIASEQQARQYVEERMLSNLQYVAKDVKVQVEFNPDLVSSYRLIGYENRDIDDDDFDDDKVDAGEIGAGHQVTALYEMVLAGSALPDTQGAPEVDDGDPYAGPVEVDIGELVLVKVRYKPMDAAAEDPAIEVRASLDSVAGDLVAADEDLRWAIALAAFAELVKGSPFADDTQLDQINGIFAEQQSLDAAREEFYDLVQNVINQL